MASPTLAAVTEAAQTRTTASEALRRACREAVAAGDTKTDVATAAGISRPTLDAWLLAVSGRMT